MQIIEMMPNGSMVEVEIDDWQSGESWESYCERIGFDAKDNAMLGDEHGWNVEVVKRRSNSVARWPLLATISDAAGFHLVALSGPMAMLQLYRFAAPIIAAAELSERLSRLETIAERAFQATHGHDAEEICQRCDPWGWKARQEILAARRPVRKKIQ